MRLTYTVKWEPRLTEETRERECPDMKTATFLLEFMSEEDYNRVRIEVTPAFA